MEKHGHPACGERPLSEGAIDHGQGQQTDAEAAAMVQAPSQRARKVEHPHGVEHVSEHHIGAKLGGKHTAATHETISPAAGRGKRGTDAY